MALTDEISSQLETKWSARQRDVLIAIVNKWQAEIVSHREKEDAFMAEVCAILGGQAGLGARLTALKVHWCGVWRERHHDPCVFDNVKFGAELKKKMLAYGDDVVRVKMSSYVACDEAWYVRERHPLSLFFRNFDTWRGIQSTQEHSDSAAKLREMRGAS